MPRSCVSVLALLQYSPSLRSSLLLKRERERRPVRTSTLHMSPPSIPLDATHHLLNPHYSGSAAATAAVAAAAATAEGLLRMHVCV